MMYEEMQPIQGGQSTNREMDIMPNETSGKSVASKRGKQGGLDLAMNHSALTRPLFGGSQSFERNRKNRYMIVDIAHRCFSFASFERQCIFSVFPSPDRHMPMKSVIRPCRLQMRCLPAPAATSERSSNQTESDTTVNPYHLFFFKNCECTIRRISRRWRRSPRAAPPAGHKWRHDSTHCFAHSTADRVAADISLITHRRRAPAGAA
jgi:hypothetical protein